MIKKGLWRTTAPIALADVDVPAGFRVRRYYNISVGTLCKVLDSSPLQARYYQYQPVWKEGALLLYFVVGGNISESWDRCFTFVGDLSEVDKTKELITHINELWTRQHFFKEVLIKQLPLKERKKHDKSISGRKKSGLSVRTLANELEALARTTTTTTTIGTLRSSEPLYQIDNDADESRSE